MKKLPLILLLIHTAIIIAIATCVYWSLRSGYPESVQLWSLAMILDLPMQPFLAMSESVLRPFLEPHGDFIWWALYPAIAHGLFGGLLWMLVGWGITWLYLRTTIKQKNNY
jgi:hypothetical protein